MEPHIDRLFPAQVQRAGVCAPHLNPMIERRDRARALLGGTVTMREARENYLPKFAAEPDEHYEARLKRATLTNFYRAQARTIHGRMFTEDPTPPTDWGALETMIGDIDRRGNDWASITKLIAFETLIYGTHYVFVDHPPRDPSVRSLQDQIDAGLRPYWVQIPADNVTDIRSDIWGGSERVTRFAFKEQVEARAPFGCDDLWRLRCYELVTMDADGARLTEPQVWHCSYLEERRGSAVWAREAEPSMLDPRMSRIPVVPLHADREALGCSRCPLDDIAWKNIEHWQLSSDQRSALTMSAYPILVFLGVSSVPTERGPQMAYALRGADGERVDAKYLEPTGAAIKALSDRMREVIAEAEIMGLQLTTRQPATTATQELLDDVRDTSPLGLLVDNVETALHNALDLTARWLNTTPRGYPKLGREFGITGDEAKQIEHLIARNLAGGLSDETLFNEMQARGYFRTVSAWAEESGRLERQRESEAGLSAFGAPEPGDEQ